jgi:opacity protein-like surface antigen
MNNYKFWLILIPLIWGSFTTLFSQSNIASWTTLGWKSDWQSPFAIQLSGQLRTKAGLEEWDRYFGEIEVEYELNKRWSTELEFRQNANNDTEGGIQGIENYGRIRFNLKYRNKTPIGLLSLRAGYDERFALRNNASESERFRIKLAFEYPIKNWKLDPEVFTEYFWDQLEKQSSSWRWGVSSERKISIGSLNLRFFLENDVLSDKPMVFIADIGLRLKL